MTRERLDQWCEKGILGLLLGILVFGPLALGAVRATEFLVLQFFTVGILLLWAVRLWVNARLQLLCPAVCWGVLAFAIYAIVRYRMVVADGDLEYVARLELIRVLIYAFLFFAIVNNLHRQESIRVISIVLLVLGMAISLYAVYQFLNKAQHVWGFERPLSYWKRGSGTYICPNHLAGFLEMLLPLGLAYMLTGRFGPVMKVFFGYVSLVILAGLAVSGSRGGWLGVAASLPVVFFVMMRERQHRLLAIVALVVLLAGGVWFSLNSPYFKERQQATTTGGPERDLRVLIWPAAVEIWQENIWWGGGPAHFDHRFRAHRPETHVVQARPGHVHNDYLNTLADWGLVGALLVALPFLLLGWGIFRSWKFLRRSPNDFAKKRSNKSTFVLGAGTGLVAILVHSIFDFNLHLPANAILAVTLMALIACHFRFGSETHWIKAGWMLKAFTTLLLGAGIFYLGTQGWRQAREQRCLRAAAARPEASPAKLAALEKAFAIEPKNFETAQAIGEQFRLQATRPANTNPAPASDALEWYARAAKLDRFDPYNPLRTGVVLHWLGRSTEAGPKFEQALKLDPNSYYVRAHLGWHYYQLGDYPKAKDWFLRSLKMNWMNNPIARYYISILDNGWEKPVP